MHGGNLPEAFVNRLQQLMSAQDYQATLRTFAAPCVAAFRVNGLKATVADVLQELAIDVHSVQWYRSAFWVQSSLRDSLTASDAFTQGRIYIQNLASMLAVIALAPKPGEEILDLAAAPGGKTLMMADIMANQGRIAAVEAVKNRFFRLKSNLQIHAATLVDTYLKDGRQVGWKVPERFDRVLLDAPCSSESRFDSNNPQSFRHWNERKVKEVQRKQKKLICSAVNALKPGGVLVYSTCSYSPEENEMVVQHALKKFAGEIVIEPVTLQLDNFRPGLLQWQNKTFDDSLMHAVRVLPNSLMHGFFICKIRKLMRN